MKKISILGSTGSIGMQALEVVRNNKGKFKIEALAVNTSIDMLKNQILEFRPKVVAVYNEDKAKQLKEILPKEVDVDIYCGMTGLKTIASLESVDIVLTGSCGNDRACAYFRSY